MAHTDEFNSLLKSLQAAHGVEEKEDDKDASAGACGLGFRTEEPKSKTGHLNLEVKSKTSRSRIQYDSYIF